MIKGGYQIIDFTGITVLDGTQSIPGAFNKIKTAGKPVLLNNVTGSYAFSFDGEPSDTAKAVLPFLGVNGSTVTPMAVVINSDDTVEVLS